NWVRKNLNGQAITAYFDPVSEGVIYAGGSGLYRSVDNGENFDLFFPRSDDLIARLSSGENNKQFLYTRSGIYPTNMVVKSVLVNLHDSSNVFILMSSPSGAEGNGIIYETADDGVTFKKIISYSKSRKNSSNVIFDFNKLLYCKETSTLYYATNEGVYKYNETEAAETVYSSQTGIVDIVTTNENGKTSFIAVENGSEIENCDTKVFVTQNFKDIDDITQKIVNGLPVTVTSKNLETEYKWSFTYLDATSVDNIYLTQASYAEDRSIYAYGIEGILHFDGDRSSWLYGNNPSIDNNARNQMCLKNRGWSDGNYKPYGIAVSKQAGYENAVLYSTITGAYYSPNGEDFYQRYCNVINDGTSVKYATNGLNEQTTYGVAINPFDSDNIFIMNTDFGLIGSSDGGKSWQRANNGVPSNVVGNSYDMQFDPRNEGVAYSLWSNRHDVPYSPGNESGKAGAFLRSTDGGKTWDAEYSVGIPSDAIPVKMSIVFPADASADATIYTATFNRGFFVSYDSGRTFTPLNDGITPVEYNAADKFILGYDIEAKDGKVFALTARSAYGGSVQAGEVFELAENRWRKIELPNGVTNPRDIYYNNGVLYISATTNRIFEYSNGVEFYNYAGGVYTYKDDEINLIFDDGISATGTQVDSKGTLFISDINGNIYRKETGGEYAKIYDSFHSISKGIQLTDDDTVYLATLGGGLLKLEGLSGLYSERNGNGKNIAAYVCIAIGAAAATATVLLIIFARKKKKK
ncbi:MAG: hypothetical protein NC332_02645, partial [Firmicutes bacterium]|nr:hypothetical protein [Bacillota bacterium]